jgi:hypothetical protein
MDRTEANEQVAEKFTRLMNATPSRYGLLSDVAAASILSAGVLLVGLFALRNATSSTGRNWVLALAVLPLLASVVASAAFAGSREKVVSWLASLPFPIDNMNGILAGTSDELELVLTRDSPMPRRAELDPALERISEEILILAERGDERIVEIKLGVIDSKRWPMLTNHRRYRRLADVVEQVLVPLGREGVAIRRLRVI